MNKSSQNTPAIQQTKDTSRSDVFSDLLTLVEAVQYLRLDEFDIHTPRSALKRLCPAGKCFIAELMEQLEKPYLFK